MPGLLLSTLSSFSTQTEESKWESKPDVCSSSSDMAYVRAPPTHCWQSKCGAWASQSPLDTEHFLTLLLERKQLRNLCKNRKWAASVLPAWLAQHLHMLQQQGEGTTYLRESALQNASPGWFSYTLFFPPHVACVHQKRFQWWIRHLTCGLRLQL